MIKRTALPSHSVLPLVLCYGFPTQWPFSLKISKYAISSFAWWKRGTKITMKPNGVTVRFKLSVNKEIPSLVFYGKR